MTKNEITMKAGIILLEQNNDLISERDEIRQWLIDLGDLVDVDPKSAGETVRDNWALFRKDIFDKIKVT